MRIRSLRRDRHTGDLAVFQALGRILARWRDDPERLAVAICAYEDVLGYNDAAFEIIYSHPDVAPISRREAQDLRRRALYRRHRRTLRARAEGLVLALQDTASDAEAWRLHALRVEAGIVECRERTLEERASFWRESEERVRLEKEAPA